MEKDNISKWRYKGSYLTEPWKDAYGFVYIIHLKADPGTFYIGQKSFWSITNPKVSKKRSNELYKGKGAKPKREKKIKESNWRSYNSSSKEVCSLINELGQEAFGFEILDFGKNKSHLSYLEAKYIIETNALFEEGCLNQWLSLKVHKNNIR